MQDLLKEIEEKLYQCFLCGYCKYKCPISSEIGWESASPRGKLYYLKQLGQQGFFDKIRRRKIVPNPTFVRRIYQCTSCAACEQVCHVNLKLHHIWEEVREWFIANNVEGLPETVTGVRGTIGDFHSPYVTGFSGGAPINRNQSLIEKFALPKTAEIVFFIGCVSSSLLLKIMNSAIKILRKSEVNWTVLEDEWCCGNILGTTGQGYTDTFKTHAGHNIAAVNATGAHTVVTCCPGCYRAYTAMYPKYVGKSNFRVLHFTELMAELLDQDKVKFKKSLEKTITYHDPCELGRLSGIFEPPRKILENIPGAKLVELADNRMNCNCCGNGGGFNNLEVEMALNISFSKLDEAKDTGAEQLISSCPNCRFGLGNALIEKKQVESDIGNDFELDMKDITELCGKLV